LSRSADAFSRSSLSRFINRPGGRIFRVIAGLGFLAIGFVYRSHTLGLLSMIWGLLALSAGVLDICFISAALGGPISGKKIRAGQGKI
jgi:hypothetical protein